MRKLDTTQPDNAEIAKLFCGIKIQKKGKHHCALIRRFDRPAGSEVTAAIFIEFPRPKLNKQSIKCCDGELRTCLVMYYQF
jgi:hypothetical protein